MSDVGPNKQVRICHPILHADWCQLYVEEDAAGTKDFYCSKNSVPSKIWSASLSEYTNNVPALLKSGFHDICRSKDPIPSTDRYAFFSSGEIKPHDTRLHDTRMNSELNDLGLRNLTPELIEKALFAAAEVKEEKDRVFTYVNIAEFMVKAGDKEQAKLLFCKMIRSLYGHSVSPSTRIILARSLINTNLLTIDDCPNGAFTTAADELTSAFSGFLFYTDNSYKFDFSATLRGIANVYYELSSKDKEQAREAKESFIDMLKARDIEDRIAFLNYINYYPFTEILLANNVIGSDLFAFESLLELADIFVDYLNDLINIKPY